MAHEAPRQSDADVILYLDIKSPYAYLAKDPARALEREYNISFDWRPLTLNIPSFLGSAKVNESGEVVESRRTPRQWQGVRYAYMDVKRYARLRDVLIYGPRKIWDTSLVHISWQWVKENHPSKFPQYLDHIYEQFWIRAIDVEDTDELLGAMSQVGIDSTGFEKYAEGTGRRYHDDFQAQLHEEGIYGVPSFILDNQDFFGRENLPMVRWILGGKKGPAPDIAYDVD